ncbi:MAG: hypothetical protein CM1200mP26_24280 [Acidimicrobiales bacterium]|nr:MAG: hypothetical protein CM1200mP26_24280 [Acidimicrobiales bacterium]
MGTSQWAADSQDLLEFLEPATGSLQATGVADYLGIGEPGLDLGVLGLEGLHLVQHRAKASDRPGSDPDDHRRSIPSGIPTAGHTHHGGWDTQAGYRLLHRRQYVTGRQYHQHPVGQLAQYQLSNCRNEAGIDPH